MTTGNYDVAIIGGGPGGYVSALYLSHFNKKICLIENAELGGICLNHGCIPTKFYAAASKKKKDLGSIDFYGLRAENIDFDFGCMFERKNKIVVQLRKGVEFLLKKRNITIIRERATFLEKNKIKAGKYEITASNIIISTGSRPKMLSAFNGFKDCFITSSQLLNLKTLPKDLVISGGGVIGCEFASIFRGLGSNVAIIEKEDMLLPGMSPDISDALAKSFKKNGIELFTKNSIKTIDRKKNGDSYEVSLNSGQKMNAEKVLTAIGRVPEVSDLNLENAGIEADNDGIKVNGHLETSSNGVYAIGDCIGGSMYAHTASHEAITACENIVGNKISVDYTALPNCIFTSPEIGIVGLTQQQIDEKGIQSETYKFNFNALGRSYINRDENGYLRVILEKKTRKIIAAECISEQAAELISEIALAIKTGLTVFDIAGKIFAHPTMSEAFHEIALMGSDKGIHSLR